MIQSLPPAVAMDLTARSEQTRRCRFVWVAALCTALSFPAAAQPDKTILFFTRHAESQPKLISTGPGTWLEDCNPSRSCCTTVLNPLGLERRDTLGQWFADQGLTQTLTHLVATNKPRTVETLQKVAALSGLKVLQYPPDVGECTPGFETTGPSQTAVIAAIRALPPGSRAVVANHSATLYPIMRALGMDTSDRTKFPIEAGTTDRVLGFNNLWIAEVDASGKARLLQYITIELRPDGSDPLKGLGRAEKTAFGIFYFALAGGGEGYASTIALSNPSASKPVNATISFFRSDGSPREELMNSAVIPPLGRVMLTTGGQDPAISGYARVSASDPVVATATYSVRALRQEGARFQPPAPALEEVSYWQPDLRSVVVGPSAPTGRVLTARLSRDVSKGIENGVAVTNVSDGWVQLYLSLADASGQVVSEGEALLRPHEQLSRVLPELIRNLPEKFTGLLRMEASPFPFSISPKDAAIAAVIVQFGPGVLNEIPVAAIR